MNYGKSTTQWASDIGLLCPQASALLNFFYSPTVPLPYSHPRPLHTPLPLHLKLLLLLLNAYPLVLGTFPQSFPDVSLPLHSTPCWSIIKSSRFYTTFITLCLLIPGKVFSSWFLSSLRTMTIPFFHYFGPST